MRQRDSYKPPSYIREQLDYTNDYSVDSPSLKILSSSDCDQVRKSEGWGLRRHRLPLHRKQCKLPNPSGWRQAPHNPHTDELSLIIFVKSITRASYRTIREQLEPEFKGFS